MKENASKQRFKVGRMIEKYALEGVDSDLRSAWTGDPTNRRSLRDLAEDINKRILRSAMDQAEMSSLEGEVDNLYRLLTADEVGERTRTQARRSLEREGMDVESVIDDFVTHQAVYSYLQKYHDLEHERTERDRVEQDIDNINRLQSRMVAVTENTIERLQSRSDLEIGDPRVTQTVLVTCRDCGDTFDLNDLPDGPRCRCAAAE